MISEPAVRFTCDGCGVMTDVECCVDSGCLGLNRLVHRVRDYGWHVGRYPGQPDEMLCLCSECRAEIQRMPLFITHPCPECGSCNISLGQWEDCFGYEQFSPICKDCGFQSDYVAVTKHSAENLWKDLCDLYVPDGREEGEE